MDKLHIIDNFLFEEDLKKCQDLCLKFKKQRIIMDQLFADYIWEKYKLKFKNINNEWIGLYGDVTLGNSYKPISKHLDEKRNNAKQKILIYLNNIENGGTIFYTPEGDILVNNLENRLVCFDISLYHSGQKFTEGKKLSIGFRPKIE